MESQAVAIRENAQTQVSMFDMAPQAMVAHATKIANTLKAIIEQQGLFSTIGGKKHVWVEGWNTMGCFLGIMPKERSVVRLDDGTYEAFVDLVNVRTGLVVGGASHICSINEKRWGDADDYARRSMAVTRATGKAFRLGFSWVMKLAGYEPTPFEEMPENLVSAAPRTPPKGPRKPAESSLYDNNNQTHQAAIAAKMKGKVDEGYWEAIGKELHGKPFDDLRKVADAVVGLPS